MNWVLSKARPFVTEMSFFQSSLEEMTHLNLLTLVDLVIIRKAYFPAQVLGLAKSSRRWLRGISYSFPRLSPWYIVVRSRDIPWDEASIQVRCWLYIKTMVDLSLSLFGVL